MNFVCHEKPAACAKGTYGQIIDRKKQSLKEGGEYEDSALLLALAAHYKWMDEITEPEIVAPTLDTSRKWKLQILT
ncbi:hypothetical protein TELCIR_21109 [Teladorsagia circumcincta]|uniref:Uncharacterized protein n=1 Tax=Teladorsagia circumcincta TaxID=45464 RepID=A0A2G9THP3_TELCI|nr:hypothetical protein TELCIR_21109 [Teladorsagia circumcincta]